MTLRSVQLVDAERYVRWFKDRDVVRYLLLQTGFTLAEEKKYIRSLVKKKEHFNYAFITETGRHIGGSGTSLFPKDKRADIGIVIGEKTEWGKGYAVEALTLIADYIFRKLNYNRLELSLDMENKRALAAYEKIGFVLEGVRRDYRFNIITKTYADEGMMSILKKDWLKRK